MTYEWYHGNGCPEKYATLEECRTTIGIVKTPALLGCLLLYVKPSQTLVAWTKKKRYDSSGGWAGFRLSWKNLVFLTFPLSFLSSWPFILVIQKTQKFLRSVSRRQVPRHKSLSRLCWLHVHWGFTGQSKSRGPGFHTRWAQRREWFIGNITYPCKTHAKRQAEKEKPLEKDAWVTHCPKETVRHQGSRVSRREGATVPSVTERTRMQGITSVHGLSLC